MKKQFNTIKFKLTLWFTILIIFASLCSIFIINSVVAINKNLRPIAPPTEFNNMKAPERIYQQKFIDKVQEERDIVENRIFWASTIAILFNVLFASISTYIVIKILLSPLQEINKLISEVNEKVIYTKINFNSDSEEIIELVTNFNNMMQRLDKAFESQKQFVQNVSHEIKTPLTVIKTNLETILLDEKATKEEINDSIKTAIKSINDLNALSEDLLLLSLMDKNNIVSEQIRLNPIIIDLVQDLQSSAEKKNISIVINGNSNRNILCNKHLLKRAISNIIENSIKYSPIATKITLNIIDKSNETIIEIIDEGSGIPEEQLSKIFNRFFRADNSRSRESGGSGLGLAITKEIIDHVHGSINFSNLHPGLKAVVILPTIEE
ncbi:MAG: HAMP domain-containing sensor histidine kinase [bacterium]